VPFPRRLLATLRLRVRFLAAMAFGVIVHALLPMDLGDQLRSALAWDAAALSYLVLILAMMARSDPERLRWRAALEDESMAVNVVMAVVATAFSLTTVVAMLIRAQGMTSGLVPHLVLCGATILLSWLFVHVLFAVHYAHRFFTDGFGDREAETEGGLAFPGDGDPDYWDFMYFSFVIAMTSQVSDVGVRSRHIRRAALVHGVLSFFFNTVILAFTVNIAAGLR